MKKRITEAVLESDRDKHLYVCDRCGVATTRIFSFYFGPEGQKVDLCKKCLLKGKPGGEKKGVLCRTEK